jgi:hypothetical protein
MDPDPDMDEPSTPTILYKYMTAEGLKRFAKSLTLRFSLPGAFNDPFELRPVLTNYRHSGGQKRREIYNRLARGNNILRREIASSEESVGDIGLR